MFAAACRSSPALSDVVPASVRAKGEIRASFALTGPRTGLAGLYESGGLRLLCPKVQSGCEAVLINTGGGIAGGDIVRLDVAATAGATVTLTTQAAERIYRAQDHAAEIDVTLSLAPGCSLAWLPQETILFDGAHLRRRFGVNMAGDARLIALETYVFGRIAMGETRPNGRLHDRWRVHRDGKLIFAEDLQLRWQPYRLARSAGLRQWRPCGRNLALCRKRCRDEAGTIARTFRGERLRMRGKRLEFHIGRTASLTLARAFAILYHRAARRPARRAGSAGLAMTTIGLEIR